MNKAIATTKAPGAIGPYSQGVDTGAIVYTSGQLGVDPATGNLGADLEAQAVLALENVKAILAEAGCTLKDVVNLLRARNPISLKVVTLLDKPSRRLVDFSADVSLFTIPDHFVIGYGLDCAEHYRNLPYIAEYGG